MITLPDTEFVPRAVIKIGAQYSGPKAARTVGGPNGLLARCNGFKSGGAMHAHRYHVARGRTADGTHLAPPSGGGDLPSEIRIPTNAVYVVWSYVTPIAWVTDLGTVEVPDVHYSRTTTHHQTLCRAWLGSKVEGVTR